MSDTEWPVVRNGAHCYELRLWLLELSSSVDTARDGEEVQFLDDRGAEAFLLELMLDEGNVQTLREFLAGDFGSLRPFDLRDSSEQNVAKVLAWSISQGNLRVVRLQQPLRGVFGEKGPDQVSER